MEKKFKVGIIGATGYVGQRFITLLQDHPWFQTSALAASPRSAGKTYVEAVDRRWKLDLPMPDDVKEMTVWDTSEIEKMCAQVDFVFCAVDMPQEKVRALEDQIARTETPVVSNNSAHRWTADVPMIIPEINPEHTALIPYQRARLGTQRGFVAVKPNCSIQSYVPALTPLAEFGVEKILVCTYQAISGAGKTFADWPEMENNMIPYIGGEEEKSEQEPLRIWGHVEQGAVLPARTPVISAQCYRVAVQEGHTAAVSVAFARKPEREEILARWASFQGVPQIRSLPSAPHPFLRYLEDPQRPQPALDAAVNGGMSVSIGRLRPDAVLDWKFSCLSHNTLRGAAGGGVLSAELLVDQGYIVAK